MLMAFDAQSEVDDDTLLARFAAGDQSAARALSIRLLPGVLALARRMLNDASEAEDVAQEAMLRLWKIAPNWETGRAKPSTWLFRVTSNLCTDRLRKKRGSSLDDVAEPVDETPSAATQLQLRERADALNEAMADLPERQRIALHLRHFSERSNSEIAEILEAVESLLARAKRALADRLLKHQDKLGLF
jgi:RNA polymerase sigma-70 factor (ECF subfamily)